MGASIIVNTYLLMRTCSRFAKLMQATKGFNHFEFESMEAAKTFILFVVLELKVANGP